MNKSILLTGSYNQNYFNACSPESLLKMGVPYGYISSLIFNYFKQYMTNKIQSHIDQTLKLYDYDSENQLITYAISQISPYYDEANKIILWIYETWDRWEKIPTDSILTYDAADSWLANNVPVLQ